MFKVSNSDVTIQSGYILVVDSWENDGDYHNTKSQTFKNIEDAQTAASILIKHAEMFGNKGDWDAVSFVGVDTLTEDELRFLLPGVKNFQEVLEIYKDYQDGGEDDSNPKMVELLGNLYKECSSIAYQFLGGSECYLCRVYDGHAIYQVTSSVTFKNVT